MKKFFAYFILVLAMSFMLCGCGEYESDGVIGATSHPTEDVYGAPGINPTASPSTMPEAAVSSAYPETSSSPQVGSSAEVTAGPAATAGR